MKYTPLLHHLFPRTKSLALKSAKNTGVDHIGSGPGPRRPPSPGRRLHDGRPVRCSPLASLASPYPYLDRRPTLAGKAAGSERRGVVRNRARGRCRLPAGPRPVSARFGLSPARLPARARSRPGAVTASGADVSVTDVSALLCERSRSFGWCHLVALRSKIELDGIALRLYSVQRY